MKWPDVLGITQKSTQCKLQVSDGQKYCHHHQWQNPNTPVPKPKAKAKPGFIYIYTYKHLYDSLLSGKLRELDWLYVDESILAPNKVPRQRWVDNLQILCKIGMTTRSSAGARILEWQNTCKHPVLNLTPGRINALCNHQHPVSGLSKMFKKLSIKSKQPGEAQGPHNLKLRTYQNGGFYVDGKGSRTLQEIENAIHKLLWRKYGQGLVYCYGCDPTGHKRHKEWFRVTIKELPWLIQTLDGFCAGHIGN